MPDGGTSEAAKLKVMAAGKILTELYARDPEYGVKYKRYMNPAAVHYAEKAGRLDIS
jgi:hypothetical protein